MNAVSIGEKILSLRKAKGLTQKELAEQLNVTDKAVSKWERGLNYPDISMFSELATVLEVSVSELLGLEENISEDTLDVFTEMIKDEREKTAKTLKEHFLISILMGILFIIYRVGMAYIESYCSDLNPMIIGTVEGVLQSCAILLIINGVILLNRYNKIINT